MSSIDPAVSQEQFGAPAPAWRRTLNSLGARLQYKYCECLFMCCAALAVQCSMLCSVLGCVLRAMCMPAAQSLLACRSSNCAVNWRQDTWSDLQLFALFNAAVFMVGACIEVGAPPCCVPSAGSPALCAPHTDLATAAAAHSVLVQHLLPLRLQGFIIRGMDDTVPPPPEGAGPLQAFWFNLYRTLAVVLG